MNKNVQSIQTASLINQWATIIKNTILTIWNYMVTPNNGAADQTKSYKEVYLHWACLVDNQIQMKKRVEWVVF